MDVQANPDVAMGCAELAWLPKNRSGWLALPPGDETSCMLDMAGSARNSKRLRLTLEPGLILPPGWIKFLQLDPGVCQTGSSLNAIKPINPRIPRP